MRKAEIIEKVMAECQKRLVFEEDELAECASPLIDMGSIKEILEAVIPDIQQKRYAVFSWYNYEGLGGWNDYCEEYDSIADAKASGTGKMDSFHVVDMDTREIVFDSDEVEPFEYREE